jgi:drug/metabolite transporter (DMT)-like permease
LIEVADMRPEYIWIVVTGLFWGAYPLLARTAGYDGPRAAFILMLVGFVPISLFAYLDAEAGWPSRGGAIRLIWAGLMMGGGLIAFVKVAGGGLEASVALPIVDVAMLLVSAVGAMMFFSEAVTLQKLFGIALLLAGIGFLRPT